MQRINEPDKLQLEFGRRLPSLILASSSPNRKGLLEKGGCSVRTFTPDADETKRGETQRRLLKGLQSGRSGHIWNLRHMMKKAQP